MDDPQMPKWAAGATNAMVVPYEGNLARPVVELTIPISLELFEGLRLKSNPLRFWLERIGDEILPVFEVIPDA